MTKKIKMSDIAKELNTSVVTVSKALSNKEGVSREFSEIIKQKAIDMGYMFGSRSKIEKDEPTKNIGIMISQKFFAVDSFYWILYRGILQELQDLNIVGILEILTHEQEEKHIIPPIIASKKLDAFIIIGQVDPGYLKDLKRFDIPFVCLDFNSNDQNIHHIFSNNFYGSYAITNYLINKGHKKIAFVGLTSATSSILDRYLGYFKSMTENGLSKIPVIPDRNEQGKYIPLVFNNPDITAYVCNNDYIALKTIKALSAKGLKVPEDVSVTGFDNFINNRNTSNVQITTMSIDVAKMCKTAITHLFQILASDENTLDCRYLIEPTLIEGVTVKDLNQKP